MHVSLIRLEGLYSHDETVINLPPVGVILVTGNNGSGKSSLVEGVAIAGWGKTLRNAHPWQPGKDSLAGLVTTSPSVKVQRTRKAGVSPKLVWTCEGEKDEHFPTTTKSQHALETVIGSFDVWRKSHVFSSADAAHFSSATDAERKRLLEAMLGLSAFDPALSSCRDDMKLALMEQAKVNTIVERGYINLENEKLRLDEARANLVAIGERPEVIEVAVDKVAATETAADATREEIAGVREKLTDLDERLGGLRAIADGFDGKKRLLTLNECPTCERKIDDVLRGTLDTQIMRAQVASEQAAIDTQVERQELDGLLTSLQAQLKSEALSERAAAEAFAEKRAQRREQSTAAAKWDAQKGHHDTAIKKAADTIERWSTELVDKEEELDEATYEVEILKAVAQVLGLKGPRALVLGESLTGLEAMANVWLAKLDRADLNVTLKPYSEKKTGGMKDAISLEVEGAGGGHGYLATSAGERRRLDVALLLGMAEVSAAARGGTRGTMFFDEVFDCLDDEGIEAVALALEELARDRCVMVITHNESLVEHLPNARRVHISGGKILQGEGLALDAAIRLGA